MKKTCEECGAEFVGKICPSCGWDPHPKKPEPKKPFKCCMCQGKLTPAGFCYACNVYPINVTPVRLDESGHRVDTDGFCRECRVYVHPKMLPGPGHWTEEKGIPRLLSREENNRRAREVSETLSGPGWPEKTVPLNERYIPRRWNRKTLVCVDKTPLGDCVVIPTEDIPPGKVWRDGQWQDVEDVPF